MTYLIFSSTSMAAFDCFRVLWTRSIAALDVVVTDKSGKSVARLEPKDFTLLDNGLRRRFSPFRRSMELLPDLILLLKSLLSSTL
jgi:hypothetical protein